MRRSHIRAGIQGLIWSPGIGEDLPGPFAVENMYLVRIFPPEHEPSLEGFLGHRRRLLLFHSPTQLFPDSGILVPDLAELAPRFIHAVGRASSLNLQGHTGAGAAPAPIHHRYANSIGTWGDRGHVGHRGARTRDLPSSGRPTVLKGIAIRVRSLAMNRHRFALLHAACVGIHPLHYW